MNDQAPRIKRLTPQAVKDLIEAHNKLVELLQKTVVEKNDDQERVGLANFIGNTLIEHAPELLSAWQVVQFEYQPLIQGVGRLLMRASASVAPPEKKAEVEK